MFEELKDVLSSDEQALEYINRVAKLNSPNGDIYEGKSADEILTEIDNKPKTTGCNQRSGRYTVCL